MRHDRLFTPGTDAGGGAYRMRPLPAGRNAYRWAMDSGLLTRRAMCALAAVSRPIQLDASMARLS